MNNYLNILQDKAKKINAQIEMCGFDKDCIANAIAAKVRSNLDSQDLSIIQDKAKSIAAIMPVNPDDKTSLLDAIEERIKKILEEENKHFSSMEIQENFIPLDIG
jgi:translation elongation factor EF-1beta